MKKRAGSKRWLRVKRVVRRVHKTKADEQDIVFWQNKSPEEKLSALQVLREQQRVYLSRKVSHRASREGLRRVYKIVKQA